MGGVYEYMNMCVLEGIIQKGVGLFYKLSSVQKVLRLQTVVPQIRHIKLPKFVKNIGPKWIFLEDNVD